MLNKGYATAKKTPEADENFTPFYAVEPIIKYIPKNSTVWLPFDQEWSAFNVLLKEHGIKTIHTHIEKGFDFFQYEPKTYDLIVSNPPYSIKDKVIKRLYELNKPFMILLPLPALQGKERYKYFKNGLQLLTFDSRISFHNKDNLDKPTEGTPFATAYFIGGGVLLPKDLIIEKLCKYDRSLKK